ncbi:hypothetical protein ANN_01482 [Periplaneta americana]|uniref:Reverse transcriptase domain-containing protein n=1 Tax=Periplaneta americana TaxID=6978 RepID=A0ABQ8TXS8_PERAM|nr:hypothetical protein ANN_01482 [Periplaneta americana]
MRLVDDIQVPHIQLFENHGRQSNVLQHHSHADVTKRTSGCSRINETYPGRWIGRVGVISPDLTPLDYYVWSWLKSEVYKHKVEIMEELLARILHACARVKECPNQFRSATQQLPTRADALEHIVHGQLTNYLDEHKLLDDHQSGFRHGHSTTTALLKVTEDIREAIDRGEVTELTLLDFSNAFGSVDIDLLLAKMKTSHLSDNTLSWMDSYLRDRQQCVSLDNQFSQWKIFGAKWDEVTGEWRKLHNAELHALYSSPDIIRNIKSRRLRWAWHVALMGESRNAYRVLVGRPEGKRPLGRPRRRWEDNIKMDLREVGYAGRDWINLAQDRDQWRAYVRAAMNLRSEQNVFQGVAKFRYLGNIMDNEIKMNATIKDRIQAGNKAYFANQKLLKSKILTRTDKIRIYKISIRSFVTYGAENWTLIKPDQDSLRKFERKIMRRIYGPVLDNDMWRIRYNQEITQLIKGEDIVRFIKSLRLQWLGHLERMDENRIPLKVFKARCYSTRERGRPRIRWMDNVMEDLKIMNVRRLRGKIGNEENGD